MCSGLLPSHIEHQINYISFFDYLSVSHYQCLLCSLVLLILILIVFVHLRCLMSARLCSTVESHIPLSDINVVDQSIFTP